MAVPADDDGGSKHTVDELFQILCARRILPIAARQQILKALQDDVVRIDLHIRGGVRKTRAYRKATPEELRELDMLQARFDVLQARQAPPDEIERWKDEIERWQEPLYERSPPHGITERVHHECWEAQRVFRLSARDDHLLIEPTCALDYPWDAYQYVISNWFMIDELWPRPRTTLEPIVQAPTNGPTLAPAPQLTEPPASIQSEAAPAQSGEEPKRDSKTWVLYAVEQQREALRGLGPQRAAKLLHRWMKDGNYSPLRVVSWSRIKGILEETEALRAKPRTPLNNRLEKRLLTPN